MADQPVKILTPDAKGEFKVDLPQAAVARVDVVDIDFVITAKDGTRLILPGAALDATSEHPPSVQFSGGTTVRADHLFTQVDKVHTPETSVPAIASVLKDTEPKQHPDDKNSKDGQSQGDGSADQVAPLAEVQPPSWQKRLDDLVNQVKEAKAGDGSYNQPPSPTYTPSHSSAAAVAGSTATATPEDAYMLVSFGNVVGVTTTTLAGVTEYIGSGGGTGSSAASNIALNSSAQLTSQTIIGDNSGDIILANGNFASGTYQKEVQVVMAGSFQTLTVTVSGYTSDSLHYIKGATYNASSQTWTLPISGTSITAMLFDVVYPLETVSTDSSTYNLTITASGLDSNGAVVSLASSLLLVEESVTSTSQVTGASYGVLEAQGLGSVIIAGSGNDTVIGGYGTNTIYGGGGNDTLIGSTVSNNTFYGGVGSDTMIGGSATNVFYAGTGGDTMIGGSAGHNVIDYAKSTSGLTIDLTGATVSGSTITLGANSTGAAAGDVLVYANTIIGSTAADTFLGGLSSGTIVLDGNGGNDYADYVNASTGELFNFASTGTLGSVTVGHEILVNIENVVGSNHGDTFIGGAALNTFLGGSGNDTVIAGSVSGDYYDGGAGTDTLSFQNATAGVTVNLSTNSNSGAAAGETFTNFEKIVGSNYNDVLVAVSNETLISGSGTNTLIGASSDVLYGNGVSDTLISQQGYNTLIGGTGHDLMYGGASGHDSFVGTGSYDVVSFGKATTGLTIDLTGTSHSTGAAAADTYSGIATVIGSTGADTFIGGNTSSSALMDGGSGANYIDYAYSTSALVINLTNTNASGQVTVGNDHFINIENVIGSNNGDTIIGDSHVNTVIGGAGNDTIIAGSVGGNYYDGGAGTDVISYANQTAGLTLDLTGGGHGSAVGNGNTYVNIEIFQGTNYNDTFIGGVTAAMTLDGGAGNNWIDYQYATAATTVDLATGTNGGVAVSDHLLNIENVIGSNNGDLLIGDSHINSILGGSGNDTIIAGTAASDFLYGGAGNDTLVSNISGNETYDGGAGTDTLTFVNIAATSTAVLTSGMTATLGLIIDVNDVAGNIATGAAAGDVISNVEIVKGTNYDDTFIGGVSSSKITYDGGAGNNWVDYSQASAFTLNLSTNRNTQGAASDYLINVENVIGSDGGDIIYGSSVVGTVGNPSLGTLLGGAGNDVLAANGGNYWLDGGTGNNTLIGTGSTYVVADFADAAGSVTVYLNGTSTGSAYVADGSTDVITNIENVYGGSGNDTVFGDLGGGTLDGAGGTDTISFATRTAGLTLDLTSGTAYAGTKSDTLVNFEVAVGSSYNDTIIAGSAYSTLDGGLGVNEISYNNTAFLTGVTVDLANHEGYWSGGSQALYNFQDVRGSAGNDTLIGQSGGNTTFRGGGGSDSIIGQGSSGNWVYFDDITTGGVTASLSTGTAVYASGSDRLIGIQNLYGSTGNDVLATGAGSGATLVGGLGNDTLYAYGSSDVLIGDLSANPTTTGNDTLYAGGSGGHTLYGSAGNDVFTILAGSSGNTLVGGSGNDLMIDQGSGTNTLSAGAGNNTLYAGFGMDSLYASAGTNTLYGSQGSSGVATLSGGSGFNTLVGGAGSDLLIGGAGTDIMIGGSGTADMRVGIGAETLIGTGSANAYADFVNAQSVTVMLHGTSAGSAWGSGISTDLLTNIENVIGSTGNDVLVGDSLANSLFGGSGNDTIFSGGGADYLDGGTGTNTVSFAGVTDGLTITLGGTGTGSFNSASYTGTLKNFTIAVGGSGADTFVGSASNESFDGGAGVDVMNYSALTGALSVNLSTGTAFGVGAGTDTLSNIEVILGGSGSNVMKGGLAADTLIGGAGNDTFFAGTGNDSFDGGGGTNLVDYRSNAGGLVYDMSAGTVHGTGASPSIGTDTLTNIQVLYAGTGNDSLIAGTSNLTFDGGSGTDTVSFSAESSGVLYNLGTGGATIASVSGGITDSFSNVEVIVGSAQADTFLGGAWSGTIDGGAGTDIIDYSAQTSNLTVNLGAGTGTATATGLGTDILTNVEVVVGGSGTNILTGGLAADTLIGGAGRSTLIGGTGNDTLDGGSGVALADYHSFANAETFVLGGTGSAWGNGIGTDALYNIDIIKGGSGGNTIVGGLWSGTIDAGAGTDFVDYHNLTSAMSVSLNGLTGGTATGAGLGTDILYNVEIVKGGSGGNTFSVTSWSGTIDGGSGQNIYDEHAQTSSMVVNLSNGTGTATGAGIGTDTLINFEVVLGGSGGNTLIAGNINDSLYGGAGNDTLYAGSGVDLLDGQGGTNALYLTNLSQGVTVALNGTSTGTAIWGTTTDTLANLEIVVGGVGDDTLIADNLTDSLYGGSGNDTLFAGSGKDILDGGTGTNALYLTNLSTGVLVKLNGTSNGTAIVGTVTDTLANIEVVVGGTGGNTLIADNLTDSLYGGGGNDSLFAGSGLDVLDGQAGNNTLYLTNISTGVLVKLNGAAAGTAIVGTVTDTLYNMEVVVAGNGNNTLIADNLADTFFGGTGADSLFAGSGQDYLDGKGGTNALFLTNLSQGVTVALNGTSTGTAIWGSTTDTLLNVEIVQGGSGGNTIIADNLADSLYGGSGNDTLVAGSGVDLLDGQAGNNALYLTNLTSNVLVKLNGTSAGTAIWGTTTDTLYNMEVVVAGNGNNTLVADNLADSLYGGSGNDTLFAGSGIDLLDGGAGNNALYMSNVGAAATIALNGTSAGTAIWGTTSDTLYNMEIAVAGTGNDTIIADNLADSIYGGSGNDTIFAGSGVDLLDGQSGTNALYLTNLSSGVLVQLNGTSQGTAIYGTSTTDKLYNFEVVVGGAGGNTLIADNLTDSLYGGSGDDSIFAGSGLDLLDGQAGNNTLYLTNLSTGVKVALNGTSAGTAIVGTVTDTLYNMEVVVAGNGNNTLIADNNADTFFGGAGTDSLFAGSGQDYLDGGAGTNALFLTNLSQGVTVTLNGTSQGSAVWGSVTDTLANIEIVVGGVGNNTLIADNLTDSLYGGSGNDSIFAGSGKDLLDGMGGTNALYLSNISTGVLVKLNGTSAGTAIVGSVTDSIANFEIVVGGNGNNTLIADNLTDSLYGGSGNDTLFAGSGQDLLDGGAGTNALYLTNLTGNVTVALNGAAQGTAAWGSVTDSLYNIEVVVAGSGNNTLIADNATDSLYGGSGNDTLFAGSGQDLLDGKGGTNALYLTNIATGVTVALNGTSTGTAIVGTVTDILSNMEIVVGGAGGNTIIADNLADSLYGGAGNDSIFAGSGVDLLDGQGGTNTLYLTNLSSGVKVALNGTSAGTAIWGTTTDTLYNMEVVVAGNGNNTLIADNLTDSLYGGIGNDTLVAGLGLDTLDGGAGTNALYLTSINSAVTVALNGAAKGSAAWGSITDSLYNIEVVVAGTGNDVLIADNGTDSLYGGSGNDSIFSGSGVDLLDGQSGTNALFLTNLSSGVLVQLGGTSQGSALIGTITDKLYNFEIVVAGNGDNTLIADNLADSLYGGSGNDSIFAGSGVDLLDGGSGNNTLYLTNLASSALVKLNGAAQGTAIWGTTTDSLYNMEIVVAGAGNDTLVADNLADSLYGGAGNDSIFAGSGQDYLDGQTGTNALFLNNLSQGATVTLNGTGQGTAIWGSTTDTLVNFQIVQGGAGGNTIIADNGTDSLYGGSGNDTIVAGSGKDVLDGQAGTNALYLTNLASGVLVTLNGTSAGSAIWGTTTDILTNFEIVVAGNGNNTLIADNLADSLYGGSGNDSIFAGSGIDVLDGGDGTNALYLTNLASGVLVQLNGSSSGTAIWGTTTDTLSNFEIVVGGSGNNTLIADNFTDSLYGGAGNDTLVAGLGVDLLDGKGGTNALYLTNLTSGVLVQLNGTGKGTAIWGSITDSLYNIEVVVGGAGNNTLIADNLTDSLYGGSGNDSIFAGSGLDLLDGQAGTNILYLTNLSSGALVQLNGANHGTAIYGTVTDSLYNFEVVVGGNGGNTMVADNGTDSLYGGGGNDTFVAGLGYDYIDGQLGTNILDYHNSASNLTVILGSPGHAFSANGSSATLYNIEVVLGGQGSNTLVADNNGDTLWGLGAADSLYGGLGNDTFRGGTGLDTIDGGGGTNVLDYSTEASPITVALNGTGLGTAKGASIGTDVLSNIEVVIGAKAGSTLIGDTAYDSLYGGTGNDVFIPGLGSEYIDGGSGNDVIDYSNQTSNLYITVGGQANGGAIFDTMTNIEVIIGGSGNDAIVADNLGDTLYGGAGNDTLISGSGNDTLDGGTGINELDYSGKSGNITVNLLTGTATGASIGTDTLYNFEILLGAQGNNLLVANNLGDTLYGNGAAGTGNTLIGGTGDDLLIAGSHTDSLYGGAGNDTLVAGSGRDILDGGTGTNILYLANFGTSELVVLNGSSAGTAVISGLATDTLYNIEVVVSGSGNNTLIADSGTDSLYGGAGNDSLFAGSGADLLDGGGGNNTLYLTNLTSGIKVALNGTAAGTGIWGAVTDTLYNMEIVVAGNGNNTLIADNNADSLYGGSGNDSIFAGSGVDTLDGGAGNNTLYLSNLASGVLVQLNGTSLGTAAWGTTTDALYNFENVIAGNGNNTLIADNLTDTIFAGSGNDTLIAGNGADSLYAGAGNDSLFAGSGADLLDGGTGNNILYLTNLSSGVLVQLNSTGLGTAIWGTTTDKLYNMEIVVGGVGNDTLIADNATDSLYGGSGDDSLFAGSGLDILDGGTGNNTLYLTNLANGVKVALGGTSAGTAIYGTITDTLYNLEYVVSGAGADTLIADNLTDYLNAGSGNDSLFAGNGKDTLDGGAGANTLYLTNVTSGVLVQLNGAAAGTAIVGGAITDTLYNMEIVVGGAGNDTMVGDANLDTFIGGSGTNTLIGGSGGNLLIAGNHNDSLYGGAANDTLVVGSGNDYLDGKGGTDTVSLAAFSAAELIALNGTSAGTALITGIATDTLLNIEIVLAGNGNNTLIADNLTDSLYSGSGNDSMFMGSGVDILDAGGGTNTLYLTNLANAATVLLNGSLQGTGIYGTNTDKLYNMEIVVGGSGNDVMVGDANHDTFIGGSATNTLIGGAGGNLMIAGNTADSIYGGGGNDTVIIGSGVDYLDGQGGTDTLVLTNITSNLTLTMNGTSQGTAIWGTVTDKLYNFEIVVGGAGNDTMIADNLTDSLYGGAGNDTLFAGSGLDILDGQTGTNALYLTNLANGVKVVLNGTSAGTAIYGTITDTLYNLEVVVAGNGTNTLIADNLTDSLYGGSNNDSLFAGNGKDVLDGMGGVNTLYLSNVTSGVLVHLNGTSAGTAIVGGSITDTLYNMEIVVGGAGNDTMVGDNLFDTLIGGTGTNTLIGGSAGNILIAGNHNDSLYGGVAADTLYAGSGADLLDGGGGVNALYLTNLASGVLVQLNGAAQGTATWGATVTDKLYNFEIVLGGAGNDTLIGDSNANSLYGGAGNDTLVAGLGVDTLDGGTGTNAVYLNGMGTTGVLIELNGASLGTAIWGTTTDALYNFQIAVGGSGNDTLVADTLNDSLYGGLGNDTIIASTGKEVLDGGSGTNTVVYSWDSVALTAWLNGSSAGSAIGANLGSDTLYNLEVFLSGSGNDVINILDNGSGTLGHTIDGGAGTDTLNYSTYSGSATVYLNGLDKNGNVVDSGVTGYAGYGVIGGVTSDFYTNIENVTGSQGNNLLVGSNGNNTIIGGSGDDTLVGLSGADSLDGGGGSNWVLFGFAGSGVTVNLATGTATGVGITEHLANIENVLGSAYADIITVGSTNAILDGGGGADTLIGGAAHDTFIGRLDGETFYGSTSGLNIADYYDTVFSSVTATVGATSGTVIGAVGTDFLTNIGVIEGANGSGSGNVLVSTGGNHTLYGYAGADTLIATGGNNYLSGGGGNDTIIASGGTNTIIGGGGTDTVELTNQTELNSATVTGNGSGHIVLETAGGTLTALSAVTTSHLSNIETIDMTNGGTSTTATASLSYADISHILGNYSSASVLTLEMNGSSFYLAGSSGTTAAMLSTVGSSTTLNGDIITLQSTATTTYNGASYSSDVYTYVHSGSTVTLDLVHH